MPGSRRPVGSPGPVSTSRWLFDSIGAGSGSNPVGGVGACPIRQGAAVSDDSARRGLHAAELAGLLAVEREPGCKLAVSVLDLPGPKSSPSERPLYGPIPWAWWLPASRLPGKSLHVGAVCWLLAGWERSASFELALEGWADLGLSRFSASRGLDELERAKLVSVSRTPGRSRSLLSWTSGPGRAYPESGELKGA